MLTVPIEMQIKKMPDSEFQFISFASASEVDHWARAEETPTGTREKFTLIEPGTANHYIFKYPKEHREHQIWSELLASFIAGDLLNWEVQHTGIAVLDGRPGNLLRYIYSPKKSGIGQEIFLEGYWLCKEIDQEFDRIKGTRHTLPLLMCVCDKLASELGIEKDCFLDFWARAFALDCLISNTDRHAENWAVILDRDAARMAPLYDNGSSLGCNIDQVGLDRVFDDHGNVLDSHLEKQLKKGRHHVRAAKQCKHGSYFEEVCGEFLERYPKGKFRFEEAEKANIDAVDELMDSISRQSALEHPYCLSKNRQKHIYAMLQIGKERIRNILDGARQ